MAKLFAIFAAQAPVGVILRRGPSDWYHVIRWDVERDALEHGAWIKGRIDEEACDISPDGELLPSADSERREGSSQEEATRQALGTDVGQAVPYSPAAPSGGTGSASALRETAVLDGQSVPKSALAEPVPPEGAHD